MGSNNWHTRQRLIQAMYLLLFAVFFVRLFQLQILDHDKYSAIAQAEHTKKFEIKASRGIIKIKDGAQEVPFVLNENRPTMFADPRMLKMPISRRKT